MKLERAKPLSQNRSTVPRRRDRVTIITTVRPTLIQKSLVPLEGGFSREGVGFTGGPIGPDASSPESLTTTTCIQLNSCTRPTDHGSTVNHLDVNLP